MADRLRSHDTDSLDWENLAEEFEDLGKILSIELRRRLRVLYIHLLKWQFQPESPDRSTWRLTIREQRREILDLVEESPSYEIDMSEEALPVSCPYTPEQVLDFDFLPE